MVDSLWRNLFVTNDGYLGLEPWPLQAGDQVWILTGGDVPFILKQQTTEGEYEIVGLAYVHDIILGEPVEACTREVARSMTFNVESIGVFNLLFLLLMSILHMCNDR